jgi:hypothetical protein
VSGARASDDVFAPPENKVHKQDILLSVFLFRAEFLRFTKTTNQTGNNAKNNTKGQNGPVGPVQSCGATR